MAAQQLSQGGAQVDLFDGMPSVGRKFLLAGRGGLNLTHSEPLDRFLDRFDERRPALEPAVHALGPEAVRQWAQSLGIDTFIGTSGRVFPTDMKAAPLLRAWLQGLRQGGVRFHMRHRWLGWTPEGALRLATPDGEITHQADATVLALGGASWARLGSDGAWVPWLQSRQADIAPLRPANCGFHVRATRPGKSPAEGLASTGEEGWSEHLRSRFAGQPVKPVALSFTDLAGRTHRQQGEFVLTEHGVEGSLIYAFSARLRDSIEATGEATFYLDLLPAHRPEQVLAEVSHPRGPRSLSTHLKSRLNLQGLKMGLLHELLSAQDMADPARLTAAIKALPITVTRPRPIDEAISTAGGVRFETLDEHLMLRQAPGVFCAGEMLDWEAPTGGYLLTACLATGRQAGLGALQWLQSGQKLSVLTP